MKFNTEELLELTTESGGRFAIDTLYGAQEFCKKIATSHYENFPVGSLLIPKTYRHDFFSVYAFSRVADDIADELVSQGQLRQLQALDSFEKLLSKMSISTIQLSNPIFIALKHTMAMRKIPIEPFQKLLIAFRQDVRFQQPVTIHDNISYCQHSANPIGELVLRIFDLWSSKTATLSNSLCTGLQLTNFWQDISRDKHNGRIYIPQRILSDYEFDLKDNLVNGRNNTNFTNVLKELLNQTESFFTVGSDLITYLPYFRLRLEIALTIEGGRVILKKCRRLGIDLLTQRPSIRLLDVPWILLQIILRHKIFTYRS